MRKSIKVDWNSLSGIRSAEREKSKLENSGFRLVETIVKSHETTLTFEKR